MSGRMVDNLDPLSRRMIVNPSPYLLIDGQPREIETILAMIPPVETKSPSRIELAPRV